jgi:hypothetical protein
VPISLKIFSVIASCVLLANCAATPSAYAPPVVDMRGVDQQKYANDLADCTAQKQNAGWFTPGGMISKCLRERGYTVTQATS